jgi:hypothetical protein
MIIPKTVAEIKAFQKSKGLVADGIIGPKTRAAMASTSPPVPPSVKSGLKRVIAHWAVTKYKADTISKQHYHKIYEGDGTEVNGIFRPEANIVCVNGRYAAHTRGCNTGSVGVSCAAMFGAMSVDKPGSYPITEKQFDAMCAGIARLCAKYGIAVTPKTVLSHAEVETTLGIKQRGKWDIAVLPFAGLKTAKTCGDEMRRRVSGYLASI